LGKTAADARTVEIKDFSWFREFCGVNDEHLRRIEKNYGVRIYARNGSVFLSGPPDHVSRLAGLLGEYGELMASSTQIRHEELKYAVRYYMEHDNVSLLDLFSKSYRIKTAKKIITPRSLTQRVYIHSLFHTDVVIGVGPAGTGKTYLVVAVAVSELLNRNIGRIILTRPAVEAGEKLGFLPGDLNEKISPYLRPLYDAMYEMLGPDRLATMMEQGEVEVAPLAYMRGRTLNDSFIILDEAQNCTPEQVKMLLTRLGSNSRVAVTGDLTQSDLPRDSVSGLVEATHILGDIEGIDVISFSKKDVVRHPMVEKIVTAYEGYEQNR
jgi:phosphate starvation-inducible PhoH-like protein